MPHVPGRDFGCNGGMSPLLAAVRRHSEAHVDANGVARTPIPGLATLRATAPTGPLCMISRPMVCLVLQGDKLVSTATQRLAMTAGDSLLVSADVPTTSKVTRATLGEPYLALVLELDLGIVAELAVEMGVSEERGGESVRVDPMDAEVADAALRLMRLLERPATLSVLQAPLLREMRYWLLAGRHGAAIRRLGWPDSHLQRISRAVAVLRAEFASTLPVARLAAVAGMSPSSFHQHFRAITTLSPRQFQKQLRLIEARRLMLSNGQSASNAAFSVGYESVQQFSRDYARMFGQPPVRDTEATRRAALATA